MNDNEAGVSNDPQPAMLRNRASCILPITNNNKVVHILRPDAKILLTYIFINYNNNVFTLQYIENKYVHILYKYKVLLIYKRHCNRNLYIFFFFY